MSSVCGLFGVQRLVQNPFELANQEGVKGKADMLVKLLRARMEGLMKTRNVSGDRRGHWVVKLAIKNLSVVAAYMVLMDHVKQIFPTLTQQKHCSHTISTNSRNAN